MKASKFFAIMMAATLMVGFASCNPKEKDPDPVPGPTPGPTPDVVTKPDYTPAAGNFAVVANITTSVCGKVFIEGNFCGYDLGKATEMVPVKDAKGWYVAEIDAAAEIGNCKVLISDEDGNLPNDWSTQWNSEKVTVDPECTDFAALVDDQGQQAMNFTIEAGSVVYITIAGWQSSPCVDYGVAKNAQLKCAGNEWTYTDMTNVSEGVFSIETVAGEKMDDNGNPTGEVNLGANIGVTVGEDFIESWYAEPVVADGAEFAIGDAIVYTFTSTNGPKGELKVAKK